MDEGHGTQGRGRYSLSGPNGMGPITLFLGAVLAVGPGTHPGARHLTVAAADRFADTDVPDVTLVVRRVVIVVVGQ